MNQVDRIKAENEIIQGEVDLAMERYQGKAPPVVLRKLRQLSERYWRENPLAVESVRLRVQQRQTISGTQPTGTGAEADDADRSNAAGEGKV